MFQYLSYKLWSELNKHIMRTWGRVVWHSTSRTHVLPPQNEWFLCDFLVPIHSLVVYCIAKLNNSPVNQTLGGPLHPTLGTSDGVKSGLSLRTGQLRVFEEAIAKERVKQSKTFQLPLQDEQPCGKRAVFAIDFNCFPTRLHSNPCAWPYFDLQFHPDTQKNLV